MQLPVSVSEVQDRLDQEAAKFDAERGGTHKFNNIRAFSDPSGANWTANFGVRGSSMSLKDSVDLVEMRNALQRVQADMPEIKFHR